MRPLALAVSVIAVLIFVAGMIFAVLTSHTSIVVMP